MKARILYLFGISVFASVLFQNSDAAKAVEGERLVTYQVLTRSGATGSQLLPSLPISFDVAAMTYTAGDTQSRLRRCNDEPGSFCLSGPGFRFGIGRAVLLGRQRWEVEGVEYRIVRRGSLRLLGQRIPDIVEIEGPGPECTAAVPECKSVARFIYSRSRGLLLMTNEAQSNEGWLSQTEILVGRCGLGAPVACEGSGE